MHDMVIGRHAVSRVRISHIAAAGLALMVFGAVALRIMTYELRVDEQLYVPPARLLETARLYEDIFYNQVPGSAWWFHAVAWLSGTDHVLLAGRMGVLAAWIVLAVAVATISYRLTSSVLATACIAALTVTSELFLTQVGMTATNNFLPLPFVYLGLGLFILGVRRDDAAPLTIFAAGFCLSLAVVFKVSAVAFIPAVAIAAFFLPRQLAIGGRLRRVVLPLAIGGVIGGSPIIFYLASDAELFLAHVTGYHTGPHIAYWQLQPPDDDAAVSAMERLLLAFRIWLGGSVSAGLVALATLILLSVMRYPAMHDRRLVAVPVKGVMVAAAAISAAALSLLPAPGFPQYFAPPLICLPIGLALAFSVLDPALRRPAEAVLLAAALVALVIAGPRLAQSVAGGIRSDKWVVNAVHDDGVLIAQRLAQAGVSGKVATLAPIYPLEGGLLVYPELATGPFAYRTGDLTVPELAAHYKMTSPSRVGGLLQSDPPAALLLGFDETLEQPLLDYALTNGYRRDETLEIRNRYGIGRLYVRPGREP